jgi:hypothetical protein
VTLNSFSQPTGIFQWVVPGVRNPVSTKPSGSFTNVTITDSGKYLVLRYNGTTNSIQTTVEGVLQVANLTQAN